MARMFNDDQGDDVNESNAPDSDESASTVEPRAGLLTRFPRLTSLLWLPIFTIIFWSLGAYSDRDNSAYDADSPSYMFELPKVPELLRYCVVAISLVAAFIFVVHSLVKIRSTSRRFLKSRIFLAISGFFYGYTLAAITAPSIGANIGAGIAIFLFVPMATASLLFGLYLLISRAKS